MQGEVIHIFRKDNVVVDALANDVIELQLTKEFNNFRDISVTTKRHINMDKSQVSNHRTKAHKINKQQ